MLAAGHDRVCRQLAGPAAERFADLPVTFTCTIHEEVGAGDHTVVLMRLQDPGQGHGGEPLIIHRSGFARLHQDDRGDDTGTDAAREHSGRGVEEWRPWSASARWWSVGGSPG